MCVSALSVVDVKKRCINSNHIKNSYTILTHKQQPDIFFLCVLYLRPTRRGQVTCLVEMPGSQATREFIAKCLRPGCSSDRAEIFEQPQGVSLSFVVAQFQRTMCAPDVVKRIRCRQGKLCSLRLATISNANTRVYTSVLSTFSCPSNP